jgi:restriction system protein
LGNSYGSQPGKYLDGLYVCPNCGWWTAERETWNVEPHMHTQVTYGAVASLRELDLTDINTPISEIQAYLLAKYEARFDLHPRVFEEVVGSVFASLGYKVRVTGYIGDDGIDVILEGLIDTIGVQVKRSKNAVKVEQIRSLAGALVYAGLTRGVFITTSDYQSGASNTAKRFRARGLKIELMNAEKFYNKLGIAQTKMHRLKQSLDVDWILHNLIEVGRRHEVPPNSP